jgi:hypothetical protein
MEETTIATITLARNASEERVILAAMGALKGRPIIAADGGSRPRFIDGLHKLGAQIVCPKGKGLVAQVKAALRAALDASDVPLILYTEPDKQPFFEKQLIAFLEKCAKQRRADLCFAARDKKSFKTFPEGQQRTERFVNESAGLLLGKEADYCYGPILLSRAAAALAVDAPEHLGWGWRFWLAGRAAKAGLKQCVVELPLPCPAQQRRENSRKDQIYRIKQARQNLEGLLMGLHLD